MTILQEHYTNTIHTLGRTTHNPLALQIAIGWAKKRYVQRFRAETITATEHILNQHTQHSNIINHHNLPTSSKHKSRLESSLSTIPELSDEEEFPTLPGPSKLPPTSQPYIIKQYRTPLLPTPTQPQTRPATYTTRPQRPQPSRPIRDLPHPTYRQKTFPLTQARTPLQVTILDPSTPKRRQKTTDRLPTHPVYNKGPLQPQSEPPQQVSLIQTREPRQTPVDPNTSTPLSVRVKKVSWGPEPVTQEAETIKPNPQLSPILPTLTRLTTLPTQPPPNSSTPDLPTTSTGPGLTRQTQIQAQIHQVPDTHNNSIELQTGNLLSVRW